MMPNMKLLRKKKGISQRQLAKDLNISQQSVYKYENGDVYPTVHVLRELGTYFDTSMEFLTDAAPPNAASKIKCISVSIDEYELIYKYRSLPAETQHMLHQVIDRLMGNSVKENPLKPSLKTRPTEYVLNYIIDHKSQTPAQDHLLFQYYNNHTPK